jgi:nitroreductase
MQEWADLGFSVSDLTYVGGQQVVKAYLNRHKTLHKTLPTFISELFDMDFSMSQSQLMCGVKTITHEEKQNNKQLRFEELFTQRTSIREFSAKNVDMKKIENAVQIAMKTPTVCNRQSFKLTLIRDKKIIEEALVLQGGWRGYPAPPLLGLVTVDVRGYVNVEERNEPFIDGGLFGMSLLLCLEAEEIATCPLNTMFSDICEQRLRQLLKLPEFEEFIMFVAIGEFPESVLAPKSMRYPAAEVMRVIE